MALRAKVSIATASRVLNGSGFTSAHTRQRVLEAARELNYRPNRRFRLMGQGHGRHAAPTGNLGILLPSLTESRFVADPYYARLFWSMESSARLHRRHVLISRLNADNPAYLPDLVADVKVDGVVVAGTCDAETLGRVRELVPIVMASALPPAPDISAAMPDNADGMSKVLQYLHDLGHRRIYYFDIHDAPNPHHAERHTAFLRGVREMQLHDARDIVLSGRDKSLEDTIRDQLSQWRAEGPMPTAVVCGADVYALAFLDAARELGIDIPGQLSVMGGDDTVPCEHVRPRLSSVRQPLETIARAAVRMLLDQIEGREAVPCVQRFAVELVLRESCAAPAQS